MRSVNDFRTEQNNLTQVFGTFSENTRTYVVQKELEVEALRRNVKELTLANDTKRIELSQLVEANEKIRQDLLAAQATGAEKSKQAADTVIDGKYREVSQLVMGNEALRKELNLSQATCSTKENENVALTNKSEMLQRDLEASKSVCSTKIGEVTSLLGANERLRGELSIAQGQKMKIEQQLKAVLDTAKNNDQALKGTLVNKDMDITRLQSDLAVSREETGRLNKLLGLYTPPTVRPYVPAPPTFAGTSQNSYAGGAAPSDQKRLRDTIQADARKIKVSANDIVQTSDRVLKTLTPENYNRYR